MLKSKLVREPRVALPVEAPNSPNCAHVEIRTALAARSNDTSVRGNEARTMADNTQTQITNERLSDNERRRLESPPGPAKGSLSC